MDRLIGKGEMEVRAQTRAAVKLALRTPKYTRAATRSDEVGGETSDSTLDRKRGLHEDSKTVSLACRPCIRGGRGLF